MRGIVFPDEALSRLQTELLAAEPNEAAAVLIAGQACSDGQVKLLIREHHVVPSNAYSVQEPLRVVIPPSFLAPLIKRARNEGWSLILAHTHPFAAEARFSSADDDGEAVLMPALFSRTTGHSHGSLVFGRRECAARIYLPSNSTPTEIEATIVEVGRNVVTHIPHKMSTHPVGLQYDRSVRAFGAEGQATLSNTTVGIVGVGGIGSIVAEQLAHLGIGQLVLLDPDVLDESNLNRLVGSARADIGHPKVSVIERMIRRIRPEVGVRSIHGDVMAARDVKSLLSTDFIFCCTDSHGSRTVVNQLAYQYLIPTIDLGVRVQVGSGTVQSIVGRIQMLAPGLPCLVCDNLLDPEEVRRRFSLHRRARTRSIHSWRG